ncbi:MAG: Gfo/Idh/MocA family oxidoreductase [Clostridia bacterium]|nr:Gfo/Idh/MocA family oxidoreductase [Clostridia bacterium]
MTQKPVTAIILGAGHRSMAYADYAVAHPDELKIVGVAEPDEQRRNMVRERFGFPESRCFYDAEELSKVPKFADVVINGTMDEIHVETSIPLLEVGYDMLLEKPFAVNEDEMNRLVEVVNRNNSKVMICHVLRYNPVYLNVKKSILSGEIGDIINIQTVENVSYHHLSTSYVRGKWANSEKCHTSMLLAKCCHDLDLMMWLMGDDAPVSVSSVGSKFQFRPENAPKESGTRCLVDCPRVDYCDFSAKRLYLDHPDSWEVYVWKDFDHPENLTDEQRREHLKTSEFGRCMFKCDNDVVDHQSVLVNFKSGATGTHNLTGGCAESLRTMRITGTKGEIYAELENKFVKIKTINPEPGKYFNERIIDLSDTPDDGHGGADTALTADFVKFIRDDNPSVSCTSIHNSVAGHKTVFLADKSRENNGQLMYI